MSKTGQQSQGGSGKPNFKCYKNGSSIKKKDKAAKTKQIAAGKKRAQELARQAAADHAGRSAHHRRPSQ